MKLPLLHLLRISLTGLCLAAAPLAQGCGVGWTVPVNHFEGVNAQGYVSYWEKVGEVDFGAQNGESLKLPLIIGFRSDFETVSPYLGKGWILGLLESRIVQINENLFLMTQPDGLQRWFWRQKPGDAVLKGQGNWMGEIKDNTLSTWADCGWRLDYAKGKIVAITTPKSRKLEFAYNGPTAVAIRENGVTKLGVELDPAGNAKTLVFNGNRMEIEQDQKPRVQVVAGQNVVGGMDRSLKKLTGSQGPSERFGFAVNQKIQPTIKITSDAGIERLITWDPATRRIAADGEWNYDVKSGKDVFANAAIGRINAKKQREFWHFDDAKGQEIVEGTDGVKKVTNWFTSGELAGRTRWIDQVFKGTTLRVYFASYSDSGKLLREIRQQGDSRSGVPYRSEVRYGYDAKDRIVSELYYIQNQLQKEVTIAYGDKGEIKITIMEQGLFVTRTFDRLGAFHETVALKKG